MIASVASRESALAATGATLAMSVRLVISPSLRGSYQRRRGFELGQRESGGAAGRVEGAAADGGSSRRVRTDNLDSGISAELPNLAINVAGTTHHPVIGASTTTRS